MCSSQGLARDIIDYIKVLFTNGNRTGCRFLTVDAHRDAIGFYEKCGFSYFMVVTIIPRPCSARQKGTFSKRLENDGVYEESVWGVNLKHLKIRVKILVKMEDILYLCI